MSDHASTSVLEPLAVPGWLAFRDRDAAARLPRTPTASGWRRLLRLLPSRTRRTPDPARIASSGPAYSPSQHRGHQMLILDDRTVIGSPVGRACAGRRSV